MQKISLVSLPWTEERIQHIHMVGETTSRLLIACRLFDLHNGHFRADMRIAVAPTTTACESRNKNSKLWTKPLEVAPINPRRAPQLNRCSDRDTAPARLRRRVDKDEAPSSP